MGSNTLLTEIEELEREIIEKKRQLTELRKSVPDLQVKNYEFVTSTKEHVTLLDLFGDKEELFVIHNMGKSCSYCTMWADGLNGVYHHLVGKAGFVLASPDDPEVQADVAAERRWQFPMISVKESSFTTDMGFQKGDSRLPGVSTFRKDEQGNIFLHTQAPFGPGDDFCITWPLFDLLPSGAEDVLAKRKLNTRSEFQLTNNIAQAVTDYEKAIPFYRDILGMKIEQTFENETKFSMSGTNFYLENSSQDNVFFEFSVENFEAAKELLLENGCIITKVFSEKSVMVADPYGMKFHVFETK